MRAGKGKTDSGFHGMTEDEMDTDAQSYKTRPSANSGYETQATFNDADSIAPKRIQTLDVEAQANDDSFVSAKEGFASKNASRENLREDDAATIAGNELALEPAKDLVVTEVEQTTHTSILRDEPAQMDDDMDDAASDESSPERPLMRKSSLNFASLPPRETLTAKRSLGPSTTRVDDQGGRSSVLGSSIQSKSVRDSVDRAKGDEDDQDSVSEPVHEDVTAHNKSSTQSLHERINMLGQSKEPRPSRPIPASLVQMQSTYPQLPTEAEDFAEVAVVQKVAATDENLHSEDDDDSWIAPISANTAASRPSDKSTNTQLLPELMPTSNNNEPAEPRPESPSKPKFGHQKSISTTQLASPTKGAMTMDSPHKKASSVSNPNFSHAVGHLQASTPAGSPRRFPDGPLSASKAKLYSVLKSAKGMFASSANAGAQARTDALSPVRANQQDGPVDTRQEMSRMPGGLYPDLPMAPKAAERPVPATESPVKEGRKTRSSTENERQKETAGSVRSRTVDGLEKAREKERKKAAEQKVEREKAERAEAARLEKNRLERSESQRSVMKEQTLVDEMPPPAAKSMLPAGKLRAPGRIARPAGQTTQQTKPAPVSIRVASQSQRASLPLCDFLTFADMSCSLVPCSHPAPLRRRPCRNPPRPQPRLGSKLLRRAQEACPQVGRLQPLPPTLVSGR